MLRTKDILNSMKAEKARKTVTPRTKPGRVARKSFAPVTGSSLWVIMKAQPWDSLSMGAGWPLRAPDEGPHRFLPVFNTREQAVKWAGGDEHVVMVVPNAKLTHSEPEAAGGTQEK